VFVDLTFFMKGKQRYGFRVGATDENGRLRIAYGDVEADRLGNLKVQPWDYKSILEDCDSGVVTSIPSAEKLQWASHVAKTFNLGEMPDWAKNWSKANNAKIKAEPAAVDLLQNHTEVYVPCKLTT
jgi:hypothetical protein